MGIQERREREREARRKAVLDAARAILKERGFNGTTTKQIAQRCELSEATLFWYFKNKDEIFVSLLFEGIDFMAKGLEEIISSNQPPRAKLAQLWRFFAQVRSEYPEYFHIFAYLSNPQSTAGISKEVKAELARRSGDNFRRCADLIREVVSDSRARVIADLLWGAFVGLMVLRDSRQNLDAVPHPNEKELELALDLLLEGIAPRPGNEGSR